MLKIILDRREIGEFNSKNAKYTGFWVKEKWYGGVMFYPAYKVVKMDGSSKKPIERDALGRIILYQKKTPFKSNNNSNNFSKLEIRLDK